MVSFAIPLVNNPVHLWGPPPLTQETLSGICDFAEHLEKFPLIRLGRICDFSASGQRFAEQRLAKGKGKGKKGFPIMPVPSKDDEGFALVDSRGMLGKAGGRGRGPMGGRNKGKGKGIAVNYQEGILGQKQKPFFQANLQQGKGGKGAKGKGKGKGPQQRRGMPSYKEWSVQTKTEWNVLREIMLSALVKLQIDAKDVTCSDVLWCGALHCYNRDFDRLTVRTERPMRRYEDLTFFNVSTSDDPILIEYLQNDPEITVIATDHVLACLIAAARSVYSWDIVVTKLGGKLIFDKRDGSQVDFLSVNETAQEPPNNDDTESVNSPLKLGQEAACINQNFPQMVLDHQIEPEEQERPNPFEDEDDPSAASGAYRYRKIFIPGNPRADSEFEQGGVSLMVRTEVNCKMPGTDGGYISAKALNEFDPKSAWKTQLETQRGAVLATELKNNAFKLGRWTAQAILAGCDTMKLGYVSRVDPKNPWSHTLLGVQTHYTDSFADQIGMTRNNMYGILRNMIDLIMSCEDGKYLILKDPTKSVLRVYELPWDAFAEEDEVDEDGDEDDQEFDEDGNVAPQQPSLPVPAIGKTTK